MFSYSYFFHTHTIILLITNELICNKNTLKYTKTTICNFLTANVEAGHKTNVGTRLTIVCNYRQKNINNLIRISSNGYRIAMKIKLKLNLYYNLFDFLFSHETFSDLRKTTRCEIKRQS